MRAWKRSAHEARDNMTCTCFHGGVSSEILARHLPFFHLGKSKALNVFGAPFDVALAGQHLLDFAAMSGNHHTEQYESMEKKCTRSQRQHVFFSDCLRGLLSWQKVLRVPRQEFQEINWLSGLWWIVSIGII